MKTMLICKNDRRGPLKVKYISKEVLSAANPAYPSLSKDSYEGKFSFCYNEEKL